MSFYTERKTIRKIPGVVIKAVPLPDPVLTEGFGAREHAGEICRILGYRSVLLLTDKVLYSLGHHEKILASLKERGIACEVFYDIDSEPTVDIVKAGREAAVKCGAQCIIALGGGSVMDSGKIIAAGARHPHLPIKHYLHKFAVVEGGSLPMINIPSTAGTGAECTVGAVVKNEQGVKNATVLIGLHVVHVILDSELMIHAPKSITIWCAIDALSHGLEGLLADVKSSQEDKEKSRECVKMVLENLPVLMDEPGNIPARQAMCLAAHYGGNAINTQLAGYVHAFAHSIGALYHIPHGKAIAWCLLPVLKTQLKERRLLMANLAKYLKLAEKNDKPVQAAEKLIAGLKTLLESCGLEKGCDMIQEKDYDRLICMIDEDSINYSPVRTFTDDEIRSLLDEIREGV